MNLYQFDQNQDKNIFREKSLIWKFTPEWKRDANLALSALRGNLRKTSDGHADCNEELRAKFVALDAERATIREETAKDFVEKTKALSDEVDALLKQDSCLVDLEDLPPEEHPEHSNPEMVKADKKLRAIGTKYGAKIYFSEDCETDDVANKLRQRKYKVIEGALALLAEHDPKLLKEMTFKVTIGNNSTNAFPSIPSLVGIFWNSNEDADDTLKTSEQLYFAIKQFIWSDRFSKKLNQLSTINSENSDIDMTFDGTYEDYEEVYRQGEWRVRDLLGRLRKDNSDLLKELKTNVILVKFGFSGEPTEANNQSLYVDLRNKEGWQSVDKIHASFLKKARDLLKEKEKEKEKDQKK